MSEIDSSFTKKKLLTKVQYILKHYGGIPFSLTNCVMARNGLATFFEGVSFRKPPISLGHESMVF